MRQIWCVAALVCAMPVAAAFGQATAAPDEHGPAWLNQNSSRTLQWVEEKRRSTLDRLRASPNFEALQSDAVAVLTDDSRIEDVTFIGDDVYQYHQERERPLGVWRRTSKQSYVAGKPSWTVVLDLDALSAAEKHKWFFAGASCRERRCLVRLSENGKDANDTREFDLDQLRFVPGGFRIPNSKSRAWWYDADTLLVSPVLGPDSVNNWDVPKTLRVWHRGSDLARTKPIFSIDDNDAMLSVSFIRAAGSNAFVVARHVDFERREYRLMTLDGASRPISLPPYASVMGVHAGKLLLRPNEAWQPEGAGQSFAAGTLVAVPLAPIMQDAKVTDAELIFTPSGNDAVRGTVSGRDRLFVELLHDGFSRVVELRSDDQGQTRERLLPFNSPRFLSDISFVDGKLLAREEAPLIPERLILFDPDNGATTTLAQRKPQFETANLVSEQFRTVSRDGTTITYLITHRRNMPLNGSTPTLVYGYGGYDVAVTPRYEPIFGKLWLERGGAYVQAYLRGGGEFRAPWHRGAMRKNRQQPFDDMEAVLADLSRRGVATPAHLGIMGRSNGGLMVATVMEQKPELMNAVVIGGPLIDMLDFHELSPGGTWLAEYGDPRDPDMRSFLRRYSPMQNIAGPDVHYPVPLIITATDDDRVLPGHARRFSYRLTALGHDNIYYEDAQGGHYWELAGGPPPGDWRLRSLARAVEFTYLWDRLGPKAAAQ